jgi:hypothetical protein
MSLCPATRQARCRVLALRRELFSNAGFEHLQEHWTKLCAEWVEKFGSSIASSIRANWTAQLTLTASPSAL